MRRLTKNNPSSLGHEITVRGTRCATNPLFGHLRKNPRQEQMAWALANPVRTARGTNYQIRDIFLPDKDDLEEQSAAGICPTKEFQARVYRFAYQSRSIIVEFHTHPGGGTPRFSSVDESHAHLNAEWITANMPDPITLMMIVGNNRFDAYDGVIYDRHRHRFCQVNRFEVLGRPTEMWTIGEKRPAFHADADETFDRQQRIPGWRQDLLEQQRIGIFGAGGNGAPLLQTLLGIGAGRRGFIAVADHDLVEQSNLPRLPYCLDSHLHTPKVTVAASYAGLRSPSTPFYAFPCRFNEKAVLDRMKMATVLFHCGDSDAGRKEINDFAVRHGIPLIDAGCDIQVSRTQVEAGGQIHVVLPGENACLVCCHGFDPAQAAIEQMDDVARTHHANHGYVIGAAAQATPSVANLNGLAAQYAVTQFLALVHGEQFAQWDYLHFDQFTGKTIPARTKWQEECPLCGRWGCLAEGDPRDDLPLPPLQPTLSDRERMEQDELPGEPPAASLDKASPHASVHPESPLSESPLETPESPDPSR